MSLTLAKNALTIQTGPVQRQDNLNETGTLTEILAKYLQHDAALIIWQRQRIIWGRVTKTGEIQLADNSELDETQILELRAFNGQEELHLIRQQGQYLGRYLADGSGKETDYVDSLSRFWGTCTKVENSFATLKDKERFLNLTIPCQEKAAYYGLVTRNYIGVDEKTGQAGYSDYRFLRIEAAEGGK